MSETTTNKYTLRSLQSKDVFPMFKIISKIGIKEFKDCFASADVQKLISGKGKEADVKAVGAAVMLEMASVVISHVAECEQDIYLFLSNLSGMSKKELEELDMVTFFEMIVDVFKKEEFKDFIGVVSKLFK